MHTWRTARAFLYIPRIALLTWYHLNFNSDSCDCLLHGRCVDVPTPQERPHVYICAFCANTPNMRGGRMRITGRTNGAAVRDGERDHGLVMGPPVVSSAAASAAAAALASSPLAHKSFRSFR